MTTQQAQEYFQTWEKASKFQNIPLLKVGKDGLSIQIDPRQPNRLHCSDELVSIISNISKTIIGDWNKTKSIEGITYLVYRKPSNRSGIEPLYVGIANSSNKKGDNISSLWRNARAARFSDRVNSNGHVDLLSRSLFGAYEGYKHWVDSLFVPNQPSKLSHQTFVHIEIWNAESHRMISCLNGTPLYVEEMHRLWVLKTMGLGGQLLNRDGN